MRYRYVCRVPGGKGERRARIKPKSVVRRLVSHAVGTPRDVPVILPIPSCRVRNPSDRRVSCLGSPLLRTLRAFRGSVYDGCTKPLRTFFFTGPVRFSDNSRFQINDKISKRYIRYTTELRNNIKLTMVTLLNLTL